MKFILFSISYLLYFVGDLISHMFYCCESMSFLYPTYNKLMTISVDLDTKYNLGVWEK